MDYAKTLQDEELTKVVRTRDDGKKVVPLKLHSQVGSLLGIHLDDSFA
jgi:hypothetical protein